jgi:flagellum-specific ATP synthase
LYTVLVDGDDMNEPIADATRGILDGHIVLSRKLASKGHFPAIEVLDSISRVMSDITPPEVQETARQAREIIATYRETEDLISIGAYKAGQNPRVDRAVQLIDAVNKHLKQLPGDKTDLVSSMKLLNQLISQGK